MTVFSFDVDGEAFVVDLSEATALDALEYRSAGLGELEQWATRVLASVTPAGPPLTLLAADRAIAGWLWVRQNGQPGASLSAVATTVPFLHSPPAEGE